MSNKTRSNPLAELFVPGPKVKPDKQQLRRAASNYLGDFTVPGLAVLPQHERFFAELVTIYKGDGGRKEVLARLKSILAKGHDEIRNQFERGRAGEPMGAICVRQHAKLADGVIQAIFRLAFEQAYPLVNPTDSERVALVATGGYGRAELSPQSDIDLLFILPYKRTPVIEQGIEFILYMLWDLGLKVGQAVRGVDDCIRQAKADMTIRTNLLECRYLAGDIDLFGEFQARFDRDVVAGSSQAFITAKLRERDERYHQMGDTRYMLEPNVKNGLGALRDLHVLFWIAKYVHEVDQVHDLVGLGELSEAEAETFDRAQNFLWAVRAHLHYLTGRGEDRLTFDLQPEISRRLGYVDHGNTLGVERFMKHYFLVVKEVGALSRIITALYQEQAQNNPMTRIGRAIWSYSVDGFPVNGGWLRLPAAGHFRQQPVDMLRMFRVAQREQEQIHPEALQSMTRNLSVIGRKLRDDPEANAIFLEILTDPAAEATLALMNDTGVLGKFLPDWARIVAQMQYDMYHVYTVDEHTLRAVSILHKIAAGKLVDEYPLASRVIEQINSKRALFVAMLLHDIAKGRNGDHSVLGEKVALKLCPRLGLSEEETETVAWLIRWHLAMSQTALKRDLEDPKALDDFVGIVQSVERLRLLLVLTTADISAVGPDRWNSWKAGLLTRLFHITAQRLSPDDKMRPGLTASSAALAEFRDHLKDWPDARVEKFIETAPGGIWHAFEPQQLARLARLVATAEIENQSIAVDTQVERALGYTQVAVITRDRKGLFVGLAGAIAANGGSILDAKIFTFTNGLVLDVFAIQDLHGNAITSGDKLAKLSVSINRMLDNPAEVVKLIAPRREDLPARTEVFTVPPRVLIDNSASNQSTVVEINGRDRPGLLYDLGKVLTEEGLQISAAKVTTYGEKAIDVFYLRDAGGLKITHEARLDRIRERLLEAIIAGDTTAGRAGSYSATTRRQERGSLEPTNS
ncbi:MAG TPA: [protein-PII] uridylyltransferase [Rhodospirillaceae bacterium]|nr:[protein-PII] uridylyltransferase [Alphaproteobacteria bacterium]OUT41020.1 MAG: [protein-PII] uridylyltransferase [Micavibrio sp. TMED2]HCI48213.1 [protein-PII] uridylyltransferase [Rhodospirillaceae bacterium]MAS47485.1 [protein-PII] uridylyltransferase [Alphaproteobacteria bacterium]MAX96643.1 [protein-PII] uridylyltransferase [Alphaproteobacteria bacterium]|tara:strand:+ start:2124 stop:5039 length:2916 start_codon:yes stop_codon:yes gene_type:complete